MISLQQIVEFVLFGFTKKTLYLQCKHVNQDCYERAFGADFTPL